MSLGPTRIRLHVRAPAAVTASRKKEEAINCRLLLPTLCSLESVSELTVEDEEFQGTEQAEERSSSQAENSLCTNLQLCTGAGGLERCPFRKQARALGTCLAGGKR